VADCRISQADALTSDVEAIKALTEECVYPYIAKPVDGARSKGIKIIENESDLNAVCEYPNNLVIQEMLTDDMGEFTTGCLVVGGKCVAVVSLTRDLRDGNTWRAYRSSKTSEYDKIIVAFAEALGVEGPANFQYRIKDGKPVIFEINGRFSGTTPLRLMFGFNEVEALLDYYLEGKSISQPVLKEGVVLRVFSDLFIESEVFTEFENKREIDGFSSIYYPFMKQQ